MQLLTSILAVVVTMAKVSSEGTVNCPQVDVTRRCRCWSSDITCEELGVTDLSFLRPLPSDYDRLYVYRNNLRSLQAGSLDSLANITSLTMQHNRIVLFDGRALVPLVSLEHLDLAHNEIEEFDLNRVELPRLRTLDLSHNGLLRLKLNPSLQKLSSVILDGNRLTLPADTFDFPNVIDRVKLSGNRIGNDLRFLRNLPNVVTLWLSENNITIVSEKSFELNKKVQFLRLDFNNIQNVDFLRHLPLLRGLNLTSNRIEHIAINTFINMSSLIYLYLGHNKLADTQFMAHISNNLGTIFLTNNRISNISSSSIRGKNRLSRLTLSDNQLSELSFISELPNLEILLVDNNNLHLISNNQFNKTKINFLDVSNNRINNTNFVPHSQHLKYLYMSNNKLFKINSKTLEKSVIEEIDFSGNGLQNIEFVSNLPSIKELLIANNNISYVPEDIFRDNPSLEKINVAGNPIANMKFVFYSSRMRSLIANDCTIQSNDDSPLKCSRSVQVKTLIKNTTLSFIKSTSELWEECYGKMTALESSPITKWTIQTVITVLALCCLILLLSIILLETIIRYRRKHNSYLKISNEVNKVPC